MKLRLFGVTEQCFVTSFGAPGLSHRLVGGTFKSFGSSDSNTQSGYTRCEICLVTGIFQKVVIMSKMNKAELAEAFEVSLPTVDRWIQKGCPWVEKGAKGKGYRFSLPEVLEWRQAHTATSKGQGLSLTEERTRDTKLSADIKAEKLKILRKEHISAKAVLEVWQRYIRNCLTNLISISSSVAPELALIDKAPEIKRIIEDKIRDAASELSRFKLSDIRVDESSLDMETEPVARKPKSDKFLKT